MVASKGSNFLTSVQSSRDVERRMREKQTARDIEVTKPFKT